MFLRGRPLWRRLRSARVQQALLFSHLTEGVMAGHEILAALLHAEEKVPADSHYLYTHSRSLGTLMGEWGCRVTSLCSEWFGATERYWDKFLRVFFLPCSLHVCIIKNLGLSARKYRCSWPVACGPCKGRHNRDFVLNSCPDCNFILSKSLIVPGVQRCYADLLLKAPSSWCDLHALMQVFWVCCVMEMELTYKAILVCHLSCHFTHFHNCSALFTAK